MNNELQDYAKKTLKEGLHACTDGQLLMFKRMYANGDLKMSIDEVVDNMEEDKLDWAMQQVQRTLKK